LAVSGETCISMRLLYGFRARPASHSGRLPKRLDRLEAAGDAVATATHDGRQPSALNMITSCGS